MLCKAVQDYVDSVKGLPFFYVVGDDDYSVILSELQQIGLRVVRISDYCPKEDKYPSIDDLIDYFRTSDVDYKSNKSVVIGIGEYLALRGEEVAIQELKRLKNTTLGNARVVLLLRGIPQQAKAVIQDDNKMTAQERAFVSGECFCNLSVVNISSSITKSDESGIKYLLRDFEDGVVGKCKCTSQLSFDKSIISVTTITTPYGLFKAEAKDFSLPESVGEAGQWAKLLVEYQKNNRSLQSVFEKHGIDEDFNQTFYQLVSGFEFKNWLFFLYLKLNSKQIKNSYLRLVVEKTDSFAEFKTNILIAICDIKHSDSRFPLFYQERKKLVKDFPESDIAVFLQANEVDLKESVYRLTDNTLLEKKTVIQWIAQNGLFDELKNIYPDLNDYLGTYVFETTSCAKELTDYFNRYRVQKVTNKLEDDFVAIVEEYSHHAMYAKLPTRDSAINLIQNKNTVYLYWIDALGAEYIPYFIACAKKKGLSLHIDVTRCDLPTITEINKGFYDNWAGEKKYKEDRLDNIKHHDKGGYYFTKCETPIHLAEELQVVRDSIERAAVELALHKCKSFVIASDHGASRLAVIKQQYEKYETDTQGEHSGRCCKYFDGCDLENAEEENGFLVLKDYGRFKGGRKANVEVHGGASLEEIVVPVITLTLKNQVEVSIIVTNKDEIVLDKKNGTLLELYLSEAINGQLFIVCNGTKVAAERTDSTHYSARIDVKRAKEYTVEVYEGNDLIGNIAITVKGKTGSANSDFDDLF